jgi:hypothetical protein
MTEQEQERTVEILKRAIAFEKDSLALGSAR